jgi:hypothetical protein
MSLWPAISSTTCGRDAEREQQRDRGVSEVLERGVSRPETPSCGAKQVTRPIRNREARAAEPHLA